MKRPLRGLAASSLVLALCLVLAASAPIALAAEAVHYTKESLQEFEQQLAGGQLQSAVFNKKIRTIRLTLKSGGHAVVTYPARGGPAVEAKLKAKGVSYTVLAPALANKELREKPKKHKIRYIAAAVLVVVIVVVGGVLLVRRRGSERD